MRKWLGRVLTTLSLLLLIGTPGIWARAQWQQHTIWSITSAHGFEARRDLTCYRGALVGTVSDTYRGDADLEPSAWAAHAVQTGGRPVRYGHDRAGAASFRSSLGGASGIRRGAAALGFVCESDEESLLWLEGVPPMQLHRTHYTSVAVPWWFLTLTFALAPARAAYKWHRARRRRAAGHCPACGYDCRATPDGAGPPLPACPECGRPTGGACAGGPTRETPSRKGGV